MPKIEQKPLIVALTRDNFRGQATEMAMDMGKEFDVNADKLAATLRADVGQRFSEGKPGLIRRPLQGVVLNREAPAFMRVLKSNGEPIELWNNAGSPAAQNWKSNFYTDFFLVNVTMQRAEKAQIVDTFGEPMIYLFGEQPKVLACAGYLMNTYDFPWRAEMLSNWENSMRGTRLVEQDARAYLCWSDNLVEGYPINLRIVQDASDPHRCEFSFLLFVTSYFSLKEIFYLSTGDTMQRAYPLDDRSMREFTDPYAVIDEATQKGVKEVGDIIKSAYNPEAMKELSTLDKLKNIGRAIFNAGFDYITDPMRLADLVKSGDYKAWLGQLGLTGFSAGARAARPADLLGLDYYRNVTVWKLNEDMQRTYQNIFNEKEYTGPVMTASNYLEMSGSSWGTRRGIQKKGDVFIKDQ